ncbi:HNH endonuclease [Halorubrum aquaticum]|uniref:HNH endonuclease n=1 Tax=Halorubrum aquaticum TaxID=387340 RepID=UPI003CD072D2
MSEKTKKRDYWECQRCGSMGGPEGDSTLHAHHILPKSKGGEDRIENLITVCHECHEQIHGHPIPSPEPANWDTSRGDRGSTTQKSHSSAQSTSGKVSMEDYLPENKQAESEARDTYPHSKYNHETPQARPRGQEDQPDESKLEEDTKNKKSDIESDDTQLRTSPHQDSSNSNESEQDEEPSTENDDAQASTSTHQDSLQSRSQDTESYSDETIGIVGTVWACIGLTLACTVVLPPTLTFARWKVGISAAFCALLFMAQLIGNNSIRYVRDFTGFMIFTYVSVTMIVAYFP